MDDQSAHDACVVSWAQRAGCTSSDQYLQAFEVAFDAIWRRTLLTLGDVTLTAIGDRVLYRAAERFPMFSSLTLDEGGLRCHELREQAANLDPKQVEEGTRFVLVEFLSILGNLTAEVLTPALHAELAKVIGGQDAASEKKHQVATRSRGTNDDEVE